jgi:hypothetical protein
MAGSSRAICNVVMPFVVVASLHNRAERHDSLVLVIRVPKRLRVSDKPGYIGKLSLEVLRTPL